MIKWELKKIIKEKSNIIALVLMIILFLQISFMKPMLETQNEYFNESKNEYFVDKRSKEVIANEKLKSKVDEISSLSKSISLDKQVSEMSKEKLKLDNGVKYQDVNFYKVLSHRMDFGLSIVIMTIIMVMISSNLYIEEQLSNVSSIILSSKSKDKVLYSKLVIAIFLPIVLYGIYIGGTSLITYIQYGQPLNGNLQAYRISDIAILIKNMTINQYVISKMITSTLMLIGISIVSLLCSFVSNNSVKSIGMSVGFIAIGKILTMFKLLPSTVLTLLSLGNYVDVMIGMSKISGFYNGTINILSKSFDISSLCIIGYVAIILVSILGNVYCIKKVLTK
ncbi:hypothetical protein QOZ83_02830 [Romboutsia sedimentorum]|uniref:hypothetical protein n=1 Tax=Romboutsia sedimentorum TaxID=1368474 RepID=UPI0024DEFD87|nr:hypothetical protein [Romboutsia sedimentorum]MDK2584781.1 hypothetical protein [Romboutsia sedimentorum]